MSQAQRYERSQSDVRFNHSIARRAFELFETRGREDGHDFADWIRAESEFNAADAERQQTKEQLAQAHKMEAIGRLAGGVAHDFNNLLNVIIGYSELLLLQVHEEDLRSIVEDIRKAASTAASLTGHLLAFSRGEVLAPKVLDLNRVVSDIFRMLPRLIGENIEVETVLSPDLGRVRAGLGQIEQVILNLAVNARDAMQNGGKLTIHTKNVYQHAGDAQCRGTVPPGSYVGLTVTDSGRATTRTPAPESSSRISRQRRGVRELAWGWQWFMTLSIRAGDTFGSKASPDMARHVRFTYPGLKRLPLLTSRPR